MLEDVIIAHSSPSECALLRQLFDGELSRRNALPRREQRCSWFNFARFSRVEEALAMLVSHRLEFWGGGYPHCVMLWKLMMPHGRVPCHGVLLTDVGRDRALLLVY